MAQRTVRGNEITENAMQRLIGCYKFKMMERARNNSNFNENEQFVTNEQ